MTIAKINVPASGVTGGYPGHHASNPYLLPQLMEAATNCVRNYCQVKAGEKVLVVAEPDTDPLVVSSFSAAATLAGAETVVMTVPPFSAGGYQRDMPSDMLVGAFERCDVVIACTYFEFAHAEKTFFSRIFGSDKRVCSILMGATPGCLVTAGRFPMPLVVKIGELMLSKLENCEQVRYVTASGTDLVFRGLRGITFSRPLERGTWSIFPPMGINFYPEKADGVFVFDESTLTGRPRNSIKISVKNGLVTGVESETTADVHLIESFANGKYYVRHTVIGTNPKVRMNNAPQFERERAAGTAYLGIDGTGPSGEADLSAPGFSHLDVIFDTPTVYVDDEMVVDRRKLLVLQDKDLVKLAAQYGDPERVLMQNSFIW
jgi:hypothetical protein